MNNHDYKLSPKSITIYFSTKDKTEDFPLQYQLYEHSITERWWGLLQLSLFNQGVFGTVGFMGQILDDEELIVTTLNYYILKINTFVKKFNDPKLIIHHTVEKGVAQNILNELHLYFEIYSLDPRLKTPLKHTFKFLNIFIHKMENFSDGKKNNCVVVDVSPAELQFLPIHEDEFKLFSPDWNWGELSLNYSQLGVPTLQAFKNNSKANPQKHFSSAIYLTFVADEKFKRQEELSDWLNNNGLSINNPRSAIGYIPLGHLINPIVPAAEQDRLTFLLKFKKYCTIKKIEYHDNTIDQKMSSTITRLPQDANFEK